MIDSLNPDIICLQEYASGLATRSERFSNMLERYEQATFGLPSDAPRHQRILSRFRILQKHCQT